MAILKAGAVPAPILPQPKVVSVPGLGDVLVRPLLLSDRLALAQDRTDREGPAQSFAHIATLLAYAVVDEERNPLFTADEWEAWGALNLTAALALWDEAWKISGLVADIAEKKPEAQSSG